MRNFRMLGIKFLWVYEKEIRGIGKGIGIWTVYWKLESSREMFLGVWGKIVVILEFYI